MTIGLELKNKERQKIREGTEEVHIPWSHAVKHPQASPTVCFSQLSGSCPSSAGSELGTTGVQVDHGSWGKRLGQFLADQNRTIVVVLGMPSQTSLISLALGWTIRFDNTYSLTIALFPRYTHASPRRQCQLSVIPLRMKTGSRRLTVFLESICASKILYFRPMETKPPLPGR